MYYLPFHQADNQEELLYFLASAEWKAAQMLQKSLSDGSYHNRFGKTAELYFAYDKDKIVGFGGIVEQDYHPIAEYNLWIASIYVAPEYRGRHLSQEILTYLESAVKKRGAEKIHILTQHSGLYEKSGYFLIRDLIDNMGRNAHIYEKNLG